MTSLISTARNLVQEIVNAYCLVKTNKDRCCELVGRCQMLVAALQEVVDQRGEDIYDQERIERLQEAFEYITLVIKKVGARGWITMYWESGNDNITIDGCHRRITDLIILFNLRELVDADNSQAFHNRVQAAISKQHGEELVRIESVNRNIIRQLEVQHHLLKKLARKLSISTIGTDTSSRVIQRSPDSLKPIRKSSSNANGTPRNIVIHTSKENATNNDEKMYRRARIYPSASSSRTSSLRPTGGNQPHTASDLSLSGISHRATAYCLEVQTTPRPQKNPLPNLSHDAVSLGDPIRVTGEGEVEAPREVEVYFVPDVADTGTLLHRAELVGRTNKSLVRNWTDAPEFVSQTLRPESGIIVMRLLPTTNPFSILPPLVKSKSKGSNISPRLSEKSSRNDTSLPTQSNDSAPSQCVYLVESHVPVLLVLVIRNENTIDRALFPWAPEDTVHQLKDKLALLLRRTSDQTCQLPNRKSNLFQFWSHRSSRWRGVEVGLRNIRFTVVGSVYTGYLNETEKLGSTELADSRGQLRGDDIRLVPGRFLKAEASFKLWKGI